jgi:hypothetical protein
LAVKTAKSIRLQDERSAVLEAFGRTLRHESHVFLGRPDLIPALIRHVDELVNS